LLDIAHAAVGCKPCIAVYAARGTCFCHSELVDKRADIRFDVLDDISVNVEKYLQTPPRERKIFENKRRGEKIFHRKYVKKDKERKPRRSILYFQRLHPM